MNILIINHYAGSPEYGMEYRPYYMAREWQKKGHKVLIVAASFAHVRSKQFKLNNNFEKFQIEGIDYLIIKTPVYNGNGLGRIFNMLEFVRKLNKNAKQIVTEYTPEVVIASSTYPLDIYPARKISKLSGSRLVFEVHDLWPLSPMELGDYSVWHPFIKVMQITENYAYKHSAKVVSILPNTLEYMIQHGLKPDKFNYIPNGIVVDEWDIKKNIPEDLSNMLLKLKEQNKVLIGYTGGHSLSNALHPLIDAMNILKDDNVALIMIGDGPEKENLIKKIEVLKLYNTYLFNSISKNLIPSLLNKFDLLYIGFQNKPLYKYGIGANKIIDYMMAGKPIIQSCKTSKALVSEACCGVVIEPENPNAIAEAVRSLAAKSSEELKVFGENGKRYCLQNHDYNIIADKFLNILSGV